MCYDPLRFSLCFSDLFTHTHKHTLKTFPNKKHRSVMRCKHHRKIRVTCSLSFYHDLHLYLVLILALTLHRHRYTFLQTDSRQFFAMCLGLAPDPSESPNKFPLTHAAFSGKWCAVPVAVAAELPATSNPCSERGRRGEWAEGWRR